MKSPQISVFPDIVKLCQAWRLLVDFNFSTTNYTSEYVSLISVHSSFQEVFSCSH